MSLPAGTQLGPYEILAPIGAGGMGEVYKARDTRLDRTVAVKVSAEQFTERFEHEARAVAALNHPHICTLHDIGPNYLVMEYVEGTPLKGPLPIDKAVEYASQILDALDAAHRKGITHRDLKPDNILVTKQGIKLLDFGLAKQAAPLQESDATRALTQAGQIEGTLQYMSPEQLHGKETDARSDLFSFGCVLYEMLTGKRAFTGESAASVIASILEREPAPLTAAPPLERVVRRALAKDPDQRFQTARDLKAALHWALEQPPSSATARKPSRAWWIVGAVAVIVTAAAAWSFGYFLRAPTEDAALRLDIGPPEGGRFVLNPSRGGFALSSDGRFVAFVASANGNTALWLRPLDGQTARRLVGTDNASNPFWSQDGRSISYATGQKLWRLDLDGGTPFQISTLVGDILEGAYTADGRLVLGSTNAGLSQVPPTGGPVAPLTILDRSRGEIAHLVPQLLPRNRLMFVARSSVPENSGVDIVSLSKPELRVRVLAMDTGAIYAQHGGRSYLLWPRGETLVAQQFDDERLKPVGEPRSLTEGVGNFGNRRRMSASVSTNGRIVYAGATPSNQLIWFDRSGNRLGTLGVPGEYGSLSISPDGKSVVAFRIEAGWTGLYLYDVQKNAGTRLVPGRNMIPVWSPDSQIVLFRSGNSIYRKRLNGPGEPEPITETKNSQYPTDWSRDGRFILYTEITPESQTKRDIWVLPMDSDGRPSAGGAARPYLRTKDNEFYARFAPQPSPHWIAYQSDESGRYEVYIAAFPEPHGKFQISTDGGTFPSWGVGGRELFYLAPNGKLMAVALKLGVDTVERSTPRELFDMPASDAITESYDVTADGQRFLVRAVPVPDAGSPPQLLHVILNWPALLKRGAATP